MTPEQNQALENLLQIVRESAEEIINKQYNERDLLLYLYQKGFEFMQNQSNQNASALLRLQSFYASTVSIDTIETSCDSGAMRRNI